MGRKTKIITAAVIAAVIGTGAGMGIHQAAQGNFLRAAADRAAGKRHSVESRLEEFGQAAQERMKLRQFPREVRILAFKEEKQLEVYGKFTPEGKWSRIGEYAIAAASGKAGPKLKEGDRQVPEGCYGVEFLHPNSRFHVALKIAYPGAEDIQAARLEGRDATTLGSDIMLHGFGGSIGCIAVDNKAAEDIFTLAAKAGKERVEILIYPYDFRRKGRPEGVKPEWLDKRYRMLEEKLREQ